MLFRSQQQAIVAGKGEVRVCLFGLGGEQKKPAWQSLPIRAPGGVSPHLDLGQIVHAGTAQPPVAPDKAAGLDHIHRKTKAGGKTQQGAAILGDIGFIEGKTHGDGALLGKDLKLHYTPRPGE